MHEQAAGQAALQPRENDLGFVDRRLGQQHHELLAPITGHHIGRAQRLADQRGERLERFVAGAVAEFVVEPLEVVDVEQADGQRRTGSLMARALGLEGLHQAAPVGDLGELVGADLVRQALHFLFELADTLGQAFGLAVFFLQTRLGLPHQCLHGPAFFDHLANHAGQAFE